MRFILPTSVFLAAVSFIACSSSDGSSTSNDPTSPSANGGNAGGGAGGGGGGGSCSCDISINGVSKHLACGGQDCVNGISVTCGHDAQMTQGGACQTASASGGGSGPGSSSSSSGSSSAGKCSLFTCEHSAIIAPCFSTNTGVNYLYEQEGNADLCSKGTTPTTGYTSNGKTTLCVPANCPQPVEFIQ